MSLLSNCTSGGCGAKIGPGDLKGFVDGLPAMNDPALLVGFNASDDAAVYKITEECVLISTVDFFSPMVEDPYVFGMIAATNALSDVYAMGGTPLLALNLVCFPQKMDKGILKEILQGGAEKVVEAGAVIGGGHSIYDHEPKYGLAVTGKADLGGFLRNNTCRAGDALILTKPLGVGLVMAAMRGEMAPKDVEQAAVDSMIGLNRYAAEKLKKYPVTACTDVTGFGLLGHGAEMAGEDYTFLIDTGSLPVLPGALGFAEEYFATAAGQRNRNHLEDKVEFQGVAPAMQEVLFDPQTSGGLLISLPMEHAQALCEELQKDNPHAKIIGQVVARENKPIIAF